MRKWTIVEASHELWHIWYTNRKGLIIGQSRLTVPPKALWNPQEMAKMIEERFPPGKLLFLLSTGASIVRVGEVDLEKTFGAEYVFSEGKLGGISWITALPLEISEALVELCRLKGLRFGRIKTIDTLEYRLANYFKNENSFWLFVPQELGIRLVTMEKGIPLGCYFFSNAPDFRVKELTRLWHHQNTPPKSAYVASDTLTWLREFLEEKSVKVIEGDVMQDMIEDWIRNGVESHY